MPNTIIAIKKSSTSSATPSSLEFGELAINYADGKLFYKASNGSIYQLNAGGSGGGNAFGTVNANGTLIVADTTNDVLTIDQGSFITIVGDAVNDKLTISAAVGGIYDNANAAFNRANSAQTIAIAAFDKANTGGGGGASIPVAANNVSGNTFYLTLTEATSGNLSNIIVSNTKLYFVPNTGTLSSTDYVSLSDRNKKTNINIIENALDKVCKLNGVGFDWIDTGVKSYGLIAQEVEEVIPEVVVTDSEGTKRINYNALSGFFVEAIKELNNRK